MNEKIITKREKLFLDLITASLKGECFQNISEEEELAFCYDAQNADVLSLSYPLIESFSNAKWRAIAKERAAKDAAKYYRHFMITRNVLFLLQEENIDACVLKGIDLASLYPVPEYRSSGDVDILLKEKNSIEAAVSILENNAYTVKEGVCSPHHVVMLHPTGVIVEIHTLMMRPFDNDKVNRKITDIFSEEKIVFAAKEIMDCEIKTLPIDRKPFYMLIHMLEHYLTAGFGIRLLCDWTVFWNSEANPDIVGEYLEDISSCGIKTFSDMVTFICVTWLGLSTEKAEFITDSKLWTDEEFVTNSERLLKDILEAGRFGEGNAARLVNSMNPSFGGLVKEFHHQMKVNFTKASKVFILWPVLWIGTLVIFLKNNRTKRGVKTSEIIKQTRKRAQLTKTMKLWSQ